MYQRKNENINKKKETSEVYSTPNITVSRYGNPPPNWYLGDKMCPFSGRNCKSWKCMAWAQENENAQGYCTLIDRQRVD